MARPASAVVAEDLVRADVAPQRRQEILRYFSLFGYRPENTALRVYLAPLSKRGTRTKFPPLFVTSDERRVVIIGKTCDPVLGFDLVHSAGTKGGPEPEMVGLLLASLDPGQRPPHEVLPFDFTPLPLEYPGEWRGLYPGCELWVGLEVEGDRALWAYKVQRSLWTSWRDFDARGRWRFLAGLEEAARQTTPHAQAP